MVIFNLLKVTVKYLYLIKASGFYGYKMAFMYTKSCYFFWPFYNCAVKSNYLYLKSRILNINQQFEDSVFLNIK